MAGDFGAELPKQQLGERTGSYARSGFASGGALEDIAGVVKIEFLRAGEVGVAGARSDEFFCRCVIF
jgi:hypothetical protein